MPNPVLKALRENVVVGLANHTVLIAKDGRETPIDDSAAPITNADGEILGGVLVFREISKRRLTEQLLKQSESRHRFLAGLTLATQALEQPEEIMATTARLLAEHLQTDRCAYAVVENEDEFVITGDFGPEVRSIVGRWKVDAFGSECVRQMLANEAFVVEDVGSDPRVQDNREAFRATTIAAVICVPLHKQGKFTAAMAVHQTSPRCWKADEIELVGTVVNRCWESLERARTNLALQQTAERLRLALAASEMGDWQWDAATDIVDFSARAAEIFGIQPGPNMTWTAMQELLDPGDASRAKEEVERAVACHVQYDIEYRIRKREPTVWVAAKGRAIYDANGTATGMFGVVQDISGRKDLENELKAKAEHLRVADRQKDDFIALLAHELRNPLAPIRTGLEVIKMTATGPEVRERVRGMMERQLDHMVRLVDDLLDVSRITRNKLSLTLESVPLSKAVDHAVESVAPMLDAAGQSIHVTLPQGGLRVRADFTRLSQVFANLLANASKFSGAGTSIEVTGKQRGLQIEVAIHDNGIGIAPNELNRVFDMFA